MKSSRFKSLTAALALAASVPLPAAAQDASGPILFTNVNVFDGVNEALIVNANVVVTGNKITSVSTEPVAVAGGHVINGEGRTLMLASQIVIGTTWRPIWVRTCLRRVWAS